jgi:hypothetical protein
MFTDQHSASGWHAWGLVSSEDEGSSVKVTRGGLYMMNTKMMTNWRGVLLLAYWHLENRGSVRAWEYLIPYVGCLAFMLYQNNHKVKVSGSQICRVTLTRTDPCLVAALRPSSRRGDQRKLYLRCSVQHPRIQAGNSCCRTVLY